MIFTGRVLALDIATTTGFAYGVPGSIPSFGHIRFTKPGTPHRETYRAFREWLELMWRAHRPDSIVYESPAVPSLMEGRTNINTTRLLIGLTEHLEEWCWGKAPVSEARVADVRVFFLGSNMKSVVAKPKTMERCRTLGWDVTTRDEADACALWFYHCGWLNPRLAALR